MSPREKAEYLNSLNAWFTAASEGNLRRIFNVFLGKTTGSAAGATLKVNDNAFTLRKIVIPGELKPDEWPRFRYVLLEMWTSQDPVLKQLISDARTKCRHEDAKFLRSWSDSCRG
jgi:hypothetical protein